MAEVNNLTAAPSYQVKNDEMNILNELNVKLDCSFFETVEKQLGKLDAI